MGYQLANINKTQATALRNEINSSGKCGEGGRKKLSQLYTGLMYKVIIILMENTATLITSIGFMGCWVLHGFDKAGNSEAGKDPPFLADHSFRNLHTYCISNQF